MTPAELATRIGLKKHPSSWRGACPACGYATAFSVRAGKDGQALIWCSNGCDRGTLSTTMIRVTGGTWEAPEPTEAVDDAELRKRKQASALKIWSTGIPAPGTLAERYLAGRRLQHIARSAALRFRPDTAHPDRSKRPALLAAVSDAAGQVIALHRTYLNATTGEKTTSEPAKASLGPVWGGAIRLDPLAAELVIGEGIESSASAGRLLGLPAWAALSAGNMARGLVLPAGVRRVVIAADADKPGKEAARTAWQRWSAEGRTVRIATPDGDGRDFNDVLKEATHG